VLVVILDAITEPLKVRLKVHYSGAVMLSGENPSDIEGRTFKTMQNLMQHFYKIDIPRMKFAREIKESVEHLDLLYTNIKDFHEERWEAKSLLDVQHPQLKVALRPYQINSVNWMLQREKLLLEPQSEQLHPLYVEIETPSGETLFYNKYLGNFVKKRPLVKPSTPGGILADEMGLGKTVEVLACILANPRFKHKDGSDCDVEVI